MEYSTIKIREHTIEGMELKGRCKELSRSLQNIDGCSMQISKVILPNNKMTWVPSKNLLLVLGLKQRRLPFSLEKE